MGNPRDKSIREAKAAGMSATDCYQVSMDAMQGAAKREGWAPAIRAAGAADISEWVVTVYGKRAAMKAFAAYDARRKREARRAQLGVLLHRPLSSFPAVPVRFEEGWNWRLDCCRDGTATVRRIGVPAFNGVSLPVMVTRKRSEANDLIVLTTFVVHAERDDLPEEWRKFNDIKSTTERSDGVPVFTLDMHYQLGHKLREVYKLLTEAP